MSHDSPLASFVPAKRALSRDLEDVHIKTESTETKFNFAEVPEEGKLLDEVGLDSSVDPPINLRVACLAMLKLLRNSDIKFGTRALEAAANEIGVSVKVMRSLHTEIQCGVALPTVLSGPELDAQFRSVAKASPTLQARQAKHERKKLKRTHDTSTAAMKPSPLLYREIKSTSCKNANLAPLGTPRFAAQVSRRTVAVHDTMEIVDRPGQDHDNTVAVAADPNTNPERVKFLLRGYEPEINNQLPVRQKQFEEQETSMFLTRMEIFLGTSQNVYDAAEDNMP